jgi:periplasmic protein TonB
MKPNEPSFLKHLSEPSLKRPAGPSFPADPLVDLSRPGVIAALLAAIIGMGLGGYSLYTIKPAMTVKLPSSSSGAPGETAPSGTTAEKPAANGTKKGLAASNGAVAGKSARRTSSPAATPTETPAPAVPARPRTRPASASRTSTASTPPAAPGPASPPQISEQINVDASIYSSRDKDVTPPIPILPQRLGALPPGLRLQDKMMIEVVLDEDGNVESAKTVDPPQNLGDAVVVTMSLSAVKSWHFRPALKDGRPVKYRQQIPVTLR